MNVKTISYSQSRETVNSMGLKSWHKYSAEAELEDGEDPIEASDKLCALVYAMHSHNGTNTMPPTQGFLQSPIFSNTPVAPASQPQSIDRKAIERLEILIDDAKTIDDLIPIGLKAYEYGLSNIYDKKYQELQNNKQ